MAGPCVAAIAVPGGRKPFIAEPLSSGLAGGKDSRRSLLRRNAFGLLARSGVASPPAAAGASEAPRPGGDSASYTVTLSQYGNCHDLS